MKSKSDARRPSEPHKTAPVAGAAEQEAIAQGVALFNARKFFEAHEAWEAVWLVAREPDKTFLQGLIQVSAAFHHYSRGNRRGMEALLRAGLRKMETAPAVHRGMHLEAVRQAVREWLESLEGGAELGTSRLPRITHGR
jgi:uncharacterized protein